MSKEWTEGEIFALTTHVECFACGTHTPITDIRHSDPIEDEDDLDAAYDEVTCCDDPALGFLIVSDKPIFGNEQGLDDDGHIRAHMGQPERWHYSVNDVLEVLT